jgi:hypothetical protein
MFPDKGVARKVRNLGVKGLEKSFVCRHSLSKGAEWNLWRTSEPEKPREKVRATPPPPPPAKRLSGRNRRSSTSFANRLSS